MTWKSHPVTERLFRLLMESRNEHSEYLISGSTLLKGNDMKDTAHEVGYIAAIDLVLNAELQDKEEGKDD